MAYPTSLDSFTNPTSTDTMASVSHADQHANANDAIEALEAKVGVDSSAVATSIDYKLTNASSSNPGHKHTLAHGATDITASVADLNKTTNFEETVSATTSEVSILTGKTLNIVDNGGLKLANTAVTSTAAELNVLDGIPGTLTATELGYVDGVTSGIQGQLDGKSATSHTHLLAAGATDVTATAAEVNVLDGIPATLTATELGYVDGVTSAIQTQLNDKAPLASPTFTGTVTLPTGLSGIAKLTSGVVSAVTAPSGTIVGTTDTQTLTNKRVDPRTNTTTSSATPTINTDTTDIFTITALAEAITSMTTNLSGTPVNGQKLIIRIKDNGTARAITWGASFASRGATLPTTTTLGKYHYVGLIWNSTASTWDCVAATVET